MAPNVHKENHGTNALLNSGWFSDVKVNCGGRSWELHRAIICPRSEYFNKASNGYFGDPEIIDFVIKFIYTAEVPDLTQGRRLDLIMATDYFRVPGLLNELLGRMKAEFREVATSIIHIIDCDPKFLADKDLDDLFSVVHAAYKCLGTSLSNSLLEVVDDFVVKSKFNIIKFKGFLERLENIPEFAVRVVKLTASSAHLLVDIPLHCDSCGSTSESYSNTWLDEIHTSLLGPVENHKGYILYGICNECVNGPIIKEEEN
ncbi:hypothetical protein AAE478_000049 [Parahypoxylon ruwenzoriense]